MPGAVPPGGYVPPGSPATWGAPPVAAGTTRPPLVGILGAVGVAIVGAVAWALLLDFAHFTLSLIAIATGSIVGGLLSSSIGTNAVSGVVAGALTAASCLIGEVAGVYLSVARDSGMSLSTVRAVVPVGTVLHDVSPITYLFIAAGAVFGFLAGVGRRNRFTGGGRRRI